MAIVITCIAIALLVAFFTTDYADEFVWRTGVASFVFILLAAAIKILV